ncbi:PAS domain-containing protein [Candidatus Saccharibacteria bacterium]|nr:PAS domain-containing protein [Candidatus Saccharibacteria bacterium]
MNPSEVTPFDEVKQFEKRQPEAIVALYSFDNRCRFASATHRTILGYSQAEMIGKHWSEVVSPEDHAHANLAGNDAVLLGQSIEFGLRVLTKAGERVPLRGAARILTDADSDEYYLLFIAEVAAL